MTIIDSQVHVYEANTPKRPWHSVPNWPDHVTGDEMVAAMNKVGVDGAIFISAFSMYQYDASYAVEVQRAHPGRFGIVKPVNPDDPAVADVIADWKKMPGTVGIRIMLTKEAKRAPDDPGLDRIARAAARHDFPVNVLFWGNVDAGAALIDRRPEKRHHEIWPSCSRACRRRRRSTGPICRRCWNWPSARTRCHGERRRRYHGCHILIPGRDPLAVFRCLGSRALPVGQRLDARVLGRRLRADVSAVSSGTDGERLRAVRCWRRDCRWRTIRSGGCGASPEERRWQRHGLIAVRQPSIRQSFHVNSTPASTAEISRRLAMATRCGVARQVGEHGLRPAERLLGIDHPCDRTSPGKENGNVT